MKCIRIWLTAWLGFCLAGRVICFPKRIPIGAIFDQSSLQAHTAFRYEIEKHNNSSQSGFKLDKYEKIIEIADDYELSKSICSTMGKGIFALFGVTNATSLRTVESYTNKFFMPYASPSAPRVPPVTAAPGYILQMRPTYDRALLDILTHYKWMRIFYVFDTEDGLQRVRNLCGLVYKDVQIDVVRIIDIDDSYETLRQLDGRLELQDRNIVLDLSSDRALDKVLKQIQNLGMNRKNYHYLICTMAMDEMNLEAFRHGGVNITGFRLIDPQQDIVQQVQSHWSRLNPNAWRGAGTGSKIKVYGHFVDHRQGMLPKASSTLGKRPCPPSIVSDVEGQISGLDSIPTNFLEAALTMDAVTVLVRGLNSMLQQDPDVFRETFRRGQVYNNGTRGINCKSDPAIPWKHGPAILKSFKRVEFSGVTGWVSFDEYGMRKGFVLDVLEMSLENEPKKIGTWTEKQGLTIRRETKPVVKRPGDEEGNTTRIVTSIESAPYLMWRKMPDDGTPYVGNERFEGYCADLADNVATEIGFDYIIQIVKDGTYGKRMDDGKWNGMVGELTEREADLAIAPLTINSMRERVIDFSKPFMRLGISIMIKKPEKQKPGVFSFMDPLSYEIWTCIIFAYIGVSIVLFLVSHFSPYEWQIEDSVNGPTFTNDFTILNSLWFSLGAFMQQGCDISPRSMSGRIVGSVWWFFTLIIISSYTANLAAFLTVERMLTPIESADDLAKQTEISYGTLSSGSTQDFFRTSRIAVYEHMWGFMESAEPSVFVKTTVEGVQRVRGSKGKYAFLLESTMNDYYNQKKPCNTMKVGGNLDSKGYGIATPLESDLRDPISLAVLTLRESGVLQKLHKKWWYDKGECGSESDSKGSSQSALTLSNVAGIFYILISGLGLSMIISLLEFLYKSRAESRRRKSTYGAALRSKSRLSMRGPERENGGYTYTAPNQIINAEQSMEYTDSNTHTDV